MAENTKSAPQSRGLLLIAGSTESSAWNASHLFASVPAVLLVCASAGFGCCYAWLTGSTFGPLLGVLSVAMALGLELSKGFAVSRSIKCFARWEFGTGLALGILALVAVAFSLQSEQSLMATSKGDLAAHREASGRAVEVAKAQVASADIELADIGEAIAHEWDGATSTEFTAILDGFHHDRLWTKTSQCGDATLPASKAFCLKVSGAIEGLARAQRKDQLRATISEAQKVLASGVVVEVADPGASALASYLEATGLVRHVDPATVAKWTLLVGVFALEAGSSLAVVLAGAMIGGGGRTTPGPTLAVRTSEPAAVSQAGDCESGWRTTDQTAPADIPPKPAPIRRETVIQNRVPPLAHEGLSVRAVRVLESLAGDSGCATNRRAWAMKLGISATTLGRALSELEAAGLVKVHADRN